MKKNKKMAVSLVAVLLIMVSLVLPVFAEEEITNNTEKNRISMMMDEAEVYKKESEATGKSLKTIDCKLIAENGEEATVKAYPTSEPVMINTRSIFGLNEIKEYTQTYVVDIDSKNIVVPSETGVKWHELGSVQAYTTVFYSERNVGGNDYKKVDKVNMGWAIVDPNTYLTDRRCKALSCGPGIPGEGNSMEVQEKQENISSNDVTFYTGFTKYVEPDIMSSIGTYQTCYINRANGGRWFFDFGYQL